METGLMRKCDSTSSLYDKHLRNLSDLIFREDAASMMNKIWVNMQIYLLLTSVFLKLQLLQQKFYFWITMSLSLLHYHILKIWSW